MVRVREAARFLDVSPSLVYALVADGRLRHYRIGKGRGAIRIPEEAIAEFLRCVEVAPKPAPVDSKKAFRHVRLP
jgi:excisionase family DNA binding protein